MTINNCVYKLQCDLYRLEGRKGFRDFVRSFLWIPTFRYVALMRICSYLRSKTWLRFSIYYFVLFWFSGVARKYGIRLPLSCEVGEGLFIEHWGGIWINPESIIGRNCNIMHGVTLGWVGTGSMRGAPIIGDHVFLGPGCAVLGKVTIGNHALISTNTVVIQDVPESGVVMGVPGRVLSHRGSNDIVKYTVE